MAWVKLDDAMPHHPKVMAAGPEAFALDVAGICYSNAHATDGFIGTHSLPAVLPSLKNPRKFAAKLVEVGRWIATEDGWLIHDVADYQPTAAEQKELSKKRAAAGRKGGRESGKTRANTKQDASGSEANTKQVASTESNPDPTRPDPTRPIDQLPSVVGRARDPIWDAFVTMFGQPETKSERGKWNAAAKELRDIGADADEMIRRAQNWPVLYPGATLTPMALVGHWTALGRPPLRASEQDVAKHQRDLELQVAQEQWERERKAIGNG